MRFLRKSPQGHSAADSLRPLLYGDAPMHAWPPTAGSPDDAEPWGSFVRARNALASGRDDEAVRWWLSIARSPEVESRSVLQAWTFLRRNGVAPSDDESTVVHGVVVHASVGKHGHDILAAYRDGSSRYLNHSGKVVVAETPPAMTAAARAVVAAAAPLAGVVGVWDEPALPPVPLGHSRVLMLTPGGFRFGQGPQRALWEEPGVDVVVAAALELLTLLTGPAGAG